MYTIYHNPDCSKSRDCLLVLEQTGQPVHVVNYLEKPPSQKLLEDFAKQLGLNNIIRSNESLYTQLNLSQASEDELFHALLTHPQLLQRPIVVINQQAILARPLANLIPYLNA